MRYRAYFAYCGADARTATWLRGALEKYRTPNALVGAEGALGPAPTRLGPFFADRIDSSDSTDLPPEIEAALSASDQLVIVCSPAAAASARANRAAETFVNSGRLRAIFPVIAAGLPETESVERDFFPPILRGRGLIPTDLRQIKRKSGGPIGEGRDGGRLRLIANLLGLGVDQLVQRERGAQRAMIAALSAAALAAASIAVLAAGWGLLSMRSALVAQSERAAALRDIKDAERARDEAAAGRAAEASQRVRGDAELQRAHAAQALAIDQLSTIADLVIADIHATRGTNGADLRKLRTIERAYWQLADLGPDSAVAPFAAARTLERLAAVYDETGHADDARRMRGKLDALKLRLARDKATNANWRSAYASGQLRVAGERRMSGDRAGQARALAQAAEVFEAICTDTQLQPATDATDAPPIADLRANACVSYGRAITLRIAADQAPDPATIRRAQDLVEEAIRANPKNRYVQSAGLDIRARLAAARQP